VQQEDQQQRDFGRDDERVRDERMRVVIEGLLSREDHQVADQMQNQVEEKEETRDPDEQLRAHGG